MSTRVELKVTVDLDPLYGAMHNHEDARRIVQMILNDRIEHYHPVVEFAPSLDDFTFKALHGHSYDDQMEDAP